MKQHHHALLQSTNLVYIKSKQSTAQHQLYLDVDNGKIAQQGAHVVVNAFHGGATQQWIVSDNGILRNAADKKLVLDVQNQKGPYCILWTQNNGLNQMWRIDGELILSQLPPLTHCLDVQYERNTPGSKVIIYPVNNQSNQKWELQPVKRPVSQQLPAVQTPMIAPQPHVQHQTPPMYAASPPKQASKPQITTILYKCQKCNALGGWGSNGACAINAPTYVAPCPCCDGAMQTIRYKPCLACQTKGGFTKQGVPCEIQSKHYFQFCTQCKGKCYY